MITCKSQGFIIEVNKIPTLKWRRQQRYQQAADTKRETLQSNYHNNITAKI